MLSLKEENNENAQLEAGSDGSRFEPSLNREDDGRDLGNKGISAQWYHMSHEKRAKYKPWKVMRPQSKEIDDSIASSLLCWKPLNDEPLSCNARVRNCRA